LYRKKKNNTLLRRKGKEKRKAKKGGLPLYLCDLPEGKKARSSVFEEKKKRGQRLGGVKNRFVSGKRERKIYLVFSKRRQWRRPHRIVGLTRFVARRDERGTRREAASVLQSGAGAIRRQNKGRRKEKGYPSSVPLYLRRREGKRKKTEKKPRPNTRLLKGKKRTLSRPARGYVTKKGERKRGGGRGGARA